MVCKSMCVYVCVYVCRENYCMLNYDIKMISKNQYSGISFI